MLSVDGFRKRTVAVRLVAFLERWAAGAKKPAVPEARGKEPAEGRSSEWESAAADARTAAPGRGEAKEGEGK